MPAGLPTGDVEPGLPVTPRPPRESATPEQSLDEVLREDGRRIVAVLARSLGDLDVAEEATQDAAVAALEVWARLGVPDDPAAWLYVAARRKALDLARREGSRRDKEERAAALAAQVAPDIPPPSVVRDDQLRLIFTCCHPALELDTRVALALRTLCGLPTAEVARVLLVPEATMGKRLTRAKKKIAVAQIPFRIPDAAELPARLSGVSAVVHLVYTAGHSAGSGDPVRADLCEEAIRPGRLVADLLPDEPSALGLLALLLLTDARRASRFDGAGDVVLLADQDRTRWDHAAVAEGLQLLERSLDLSEGVADPYQLQAAIAACHATAPTPEATDWVEIDRLYRLLVDVHPNPVVEMNAAVARAEVDGPAAGLAVLDRVEPPARSHLWHAARAVMLRRLDRSTTPATPSASRSRRRPPTPSAASCAAASPTSADLDPDPGGGRPARPTRPASTTSRGRALRPGSPPPVTFVCRAGRRPTEPTDRPDSPTCRRADRPNPPTGPTHRRVDVPTGPALRPAGRRADRGQRRPTRRPETLAGVR
ncbi:MAG: sigma-70 family RNA polymerase sigma factor [Acidimicrobiales bacterium]|nr:sigma-70 family RNA polymerase sigma factor [Acidimicrobiales bacterium]